MANIILWPIIKKTATQVAKQAILAKPLNKHEDLVVKEMTNKKSPMHKDVSKWNDKDLKKALSSPSYKYNYTLQNKVKSYNKKKKTK